MIRYKDVKLRQKKDLEQRLAGYNIYRYLSNPFTWIFLNLNISPNAITLLSFFPPIVGFYFLSLGSVFSLFIGVFCFLIFKILDVCDGEISRFTNKRSLEGVYFDRINHYVFSCCFGIGMGLGLAKLFNNYIFNLLGLIFALIFILESAINDILKSFLREGILNQKSQLPKTPNLDKFLQKKLLDNIYDNCYWEHGNLFSKALGIYPHQGLIYTDTLTIPVFLFITGATLFLDKFIIMIPLYLLIVTISKVIWTIRFIYKMEKNRYITSTLEKFKYPKKKEVHGAAQNATKF